MMYSCTNCIADTGSNNRVNCHRVTSRWRCHHRSPESNTDTRPNSHCSNCATCPAVFRYVCILCGTVYAL